MTGRSTTHFIGASFFLITILATCLSVIGIILVADEHAPTWASLFFYCILAISVSLSGTIGYLFYIPNKK